MKAFLSHSSSDKEFVRAVALELGRQYCLFDEQAFESGEEFKSAIERGLDESSVFVLFASQAALRSVWVKFEAEEVWFRRLESKLSRSLVYLTGTDVRVENLPAWLRRAKARPQNSPKIVARDIRHHLDALLLERRHSVFVGRSSDSHSLQEAFFPIDGAPPPHALFVTGLPHIGRRSLVRETAPQILNLPKLEEVPIGEGDSLNDIAIRVAERVEPYSTREGFERLFRLIQGLSPEVALQRTLDNLRKMVADGELPVFYDHGGLLDSEGYIQAPVRAPLNSLGPGDSAYIVLVSHRRPQRDDLAVPVVQLAPLKFDDMKRLLTLLANREGLAIPPSQIAELAEYVAGYPPAAYFAIRQAKDYGVELVVANKTRLVQFRTNAVLQHLGSLTLDDQERVLLRLLGWYSPLPLPVLVSVLSAPHEPLTEKIMRLIDLALVIPTPEGYYRIAEPVADAVIHAYGWPQDDLHRTLADALGSFLASSDAEGPRLELCGLRFRAARFAGIPATDPSLLRLASDLIATVEQLYHARKYEMAVETARIAVSERPNNEQARSYLIRGLIQTEQFNEAEVQLGNLAKHAPVRNVQFLRGFLARKQGNIPAAIEAFSESRRLGRHDAALSRELAHCYLLAGDLPQAAKEINDAVSTHPNNEFILDLAAQIAIRSADEHSAWTAINQLKLVARPVQYLHRLSRAEWVFGRLPEALDAARRAVQSDPAPPFQVIAQLAYCEIEAGNLKPAAELLDRLDSDFQNIRRDVRVALRCRYEVARGRFADALAQCERIGDKTTDFYKRVRRDALEGELRQAVLNDRLRAQYDAELLRLNEELRFISRDRLAPAELDFLPRTSSPDRD